MAEPPFDAETMLRVYRDDSGPSPELQARMLAALHTQIDAPAAAAAAVTSTGAAATAGSGLGIAKVLAAIVLTTTAAVGSAAVGRMWMATPSAIAPGALPTGGLTERAGDDPPIEEASTSVAPSVPEPPMLPVPAEVGPPPEPTGVAADPIPRPEPSRGKRPRKPATKARSSNAPDSGLADEARLLRDADRALRSDRLGEAEGLLAQFEREHPGGKLERQATVLRLLLDCTRNATGAQKSARKFLERHPEHRARARLESRCIQEEPSP